MKRPHVRRPLTFEQFCHYYIILSRAASHMSCLFSFNSDSGTVLHCVWSCGLFLTVICFNWPAIIRTSIEREDSFILLTNNICVALNKWYRAVKIHYHLFRRTYNACAISVFNLILFRFLFFSLFFNTNHILLYWLALNWARRNDMGLPCYP